MQNIISKINDGFKEIEISGQIVFKAIMTKELYEKIHASGHCNTRKIEGKIYRYLWTADVLFDGAKDNEIKLIGGYGKTLVVNLVN